MRLLWRIARRLGKLEDRMTPAQCIVLVFVVIILLGAGLLCLPVASRSGEPCDFMTALFTAASATCVTGLTVVDTYAHWTLFGQGVILVLMQIGGLGFMSILSIFLLMLRTRIGLRQRMLMAESLGLDSLQGIVRLIRLVLIVTVVFELAGAVLLALRFSLDMPLGQAAWMGLFHGVSAFCNGGMSLMQLEHYLADPVVNGIIIILVLAGGSGFIVWRDLRHCRWRWRKLSVYTKLVLLVSGTLMLTGWLLFALFEWDNPATIGGLSTGDKLLATLFQSVNTRAAGFTCFDQGAMSDPAKLVTSLWMLIGGASGSTAGGIKTVTVAVVLLSAWSSIRQKRHVTIFRRTLAPEQISNAQAITAIMVTMALVGTLILCAWEGVSMADALCEITAALGTGGMSTGLTAELSLPMQGMLICMMFFGRVGLLTIGVGFMVRDRAEDRYHYAETKLLIG